MSVIKQRTNEQTNKRNSSQHESQWGGSHCSCDGRQLSDMPCLFYILGRHTPMNVLSIVIIISAAIWSGQLLLTAVVTWKLLSNSYTGVPGGMCQTSGGCSLC